MIKNTLHNFLIAFMIEKLDNKDMGMAQKIPTVFQLSYRVEAELLNAVDFPPLKRPLEAYINSNTLFYGYRKEKELAGIIEINQHQNHTHIDSLVVNPEYFRQGVATALLEFVIETIESPLMVVETGLDNKPAIKLYQQLDFKEVEQWDTDHGVRKIKMERKTFL